MPWPWVSRRFLMDTLVRMEAVQSQWLKAVDDLMASKADAARWQALYEAAQLTLASKDEVVERLRADLKRSQEKETEDPWAIDAQELKRIRENMAIDPLGTLAGSETGTES